MGPTTLGGLPSPLSSKAGWPSMEASQPLPDAMPDGRPWPRISIVTPSYNQGRFLEETIRSVLLQGYPNLEYIIMDGGSTDNSVEIIKRYEPCLTYWTSGPDQGQVDAINNGLERVTGQWFNWLNSDDLLLPGALETLAILAALAPDAQWITGAAMVLSETGAPVDHWVPWRTHPAVLGLGWPSFPQDATFVRPGFMRRHGLGIPPELSNVFDTAFQWKLVEHGSPLLTSACFSAMRVHPLQKTANLANRARESRIWLDPLERGMPLWARLWLRLLRTRFHGLFRALLSLSVSYGLTPTSRRWRAAVYDQQRCAWRLALARHAVLF